MFETEELNEIASLLHVTSEIATNHPKLGGIARACQKRLDEINLELVKAESEEAEAKRKEAADRQAKAYVAPKPGDPNYVEPEKPLKEPSVLDKPVGSFVDPHVADPNAHVEVERRV